MTELTGSITTGVTLTGTLAVVDLEDGSVVTGNALAGQLTGGAKGATGPTGPTGPAGADGLTVSVNSVTHVAGNITIDPDDLDDTSTINKFVTAADITNLGNLSGTNTGDQDLSTYQLKPAEGAFANGDKTKLDGIEALADVTDATNVASAGAVMDSDFSANGVMTRTAAGTYTNRTITGTTNQITVTNGDGVSGNPTLSLPQDIHTGASPTFAGLTLNSSTQSFAIYNTFTNTSNYENVTMGYASNAFYISSGANGTGASRPITIAASTGDNQTIGKHRITVNPGSPAFDFIVGGGDTAAIFMRFASTIGGTSGTHDILSLSPTINQSSTAGYTVLLINPTETATGSGAKCLIDAKVGGVSKFKVDNTGGIETTVAGGGIIMASPDGTRYKVTVANGGTIAVAAA